MKLPTPHRMLWPKVAMTLETLELADAALAEYWENLTPIPIEHQKPADCFEVQGWRSTLKLFISLLSVEPCPQPIFEAMKECVARQDSALERAQAALCFAASSLDEAVEMLDCISESDAWYDRLTAAYSIFSEMDLRIQWLIEGQGNSVWPLLLFSEN
jgi:hypothetical protein